MPTATRTVLLALGLGALAQYLFYREGIGLNVLASAVAFIAAAWSARTSQPATIDLWLPAFAVAFGAVAAVRTEAPLVVFDLLALLTLLFAWSASLRGFVVTRARFPELLAEAIRTATGALWRGVPLVVAGVEPLSRTAPRVSRALPYVAGIALALPFLAIFIALFRSADIVFARAWDDLFDFTRWWSWLGEAKDRALIALLFTTLAGGVLAWRAAGTGPQLRVRAAAALPTAFLGALAALFAAFVYVQVTYLFGGSDTLAAASISYSDYARRGFCELLFVAGLVGAILFITDLIVDRPSRGYVAIAVALLGLTLVIAASAAYRLALYQHAYGWSEQRLYAGAAIAAVAGALAILAWAVVTRHTVIAAQPIVALTFAVALGLNALGPADLTVRANVSRAISPSDDAKARQLDAWYLTYLGPAALPAIAAERGRLPEEDRRCIDFTLFHRYLAENTRAPSWQSWNADRERARGVIIGLKDTVFAGIDPRDQTACRYR